MIMIILQISLKLRSLRLDLNKLLQKSYGICQNNLLMI